MRGFLIRWLSAVLLSTVLAVMTAWVSNLSFTNNLQTEPVFKERKYHRLTNENLVDYLLSRQIRLPIQQAHLHQHKIYLELSAAQWTKQEMDHELVRVICQILEQTENIDEVHVLVHFKPGESYFVEANKEDLLATRSKSLKALSDQEILEEVFKVTRFSSRSRK